MRPFYDGDEGGVGYLLRFLRSLLYEGGFRDWGRGWGWDKGSEMPRQFLNVDVESVRLGGVAVNRRASDETVHLVFGISSRRTLLGLMMRSGVLEGFHGRGDRIDHICWLRFSVNAWSEDLGKGGCR